MAEQEISQQVLDRFRKVAVATVYSGVRQMGYEPCFMKGVRAMTPGARLAGRARTLRFVPPRPDIIKETSRGADSPEYQAMGSCGPGDVIVMDALGKSWASIGGDVKLLQLKMVGAEGLVTDGAIRDFDAVNRYGMKLFAGGRTGAVGQPDIAPYEANVTIQCGGVAVRPGDVIVGDDDGVVVVARSIALQVLEYAEEHEQLEEHIKSMIEKEKVAPGKYYNAETFKRLSEERRVRAR
jgi:5-oxopent-3-ene-1,2,5-tricarboxylate decarboxylase/2-hydroxyhepta-2,4-diene-1,7-dioate isomerase